LLPFTALRPLVGEHATSLKKPSLPITPDEYTHSQLLPLDICIYSRSWRIRDSDL